MFKLYVFRFLSFQFEFSKKLSFQTAFYRSSGGWLSLERRSKDAFLLFCLSMYASKVCVSMGFEERRMWPVKHNLKKGNGKQYLLILNIYLGKN